MGMMKKTEIIIGTSFDVMNELGSGFLESIYHQSLALSQKGFDVQSEVPMAVSFRGFNVGNFKADFVIDREIIVEVKAVDKIYSKDIHPSYPIHPDKFLYILTSKIIRIGMI